MWTVLWPRSIRRTRERLPVQVRERLEAWAVLVRHGGPAALRPFPGYSDEALQGKWKGFRSSRLNRQYRVIYRSDADVLTVIVVKVTAHDYRR